MKNKIQLATSIFIEIPGKGLTIQAAFHSLSLDLKIFGNNEQKILGNSVDSISKTIIADFWNIGFILQRIDVIRSLAIKDNNWSDFWRISTANDIDYFHIKIRSILDNVALLVKHTSNKKGQLPDSFNDLFTKIDKFKNKLDKEIVAIILDNNWYSSARDVRDKLVHYNASTLVFGSPSDGTHFQTYCKSFNAMIKDRVIMVNENVVDFEKYGALVLINLIVLLEKVSNRFYELQGMVNSKNSFLSSPGVYSIQRMIVNSQKWINA